MSMFANLQKMYDTELYDSVIPMANLLLSLYAADRQLLTAAQHLLTHIYLARSLLACGHPERASLIYTRATQARKSCARLQRSHSTASAELAAALERHPASDLAYHSALCSEALGQPAEAIFQLLAIPASQRGLKHNLLLVRLANQQPTNQDRKFAVAPLKAILLECPLHCDTIHGLAAMGVRCSEINALLTEATAGAGPDWLYAYAAAACLMYAGSFTEAIDELRGAAGEPGIGQSEELLVLLGRLHHYAGDGERAYAVLRRAYEANPQLGAVGVMTLAELHAAQRNADALDRMAMVGGTPVASAGPGGQQSAEHWYVLAQRLAVGGELAKALSFAQKSSAMRARNVEAALLQVQLLGHMKQQAAVAAGEVEELGRLLRKLQEWADYRFEVYEAQVNAHIAAGKLFNAQLVAKQAMQKFKSNITARYFVLLVRPYLVKCSVQYAEQIKQALRKALEKDEYYMPAALLLVAMIRKEGDRLGAAELLQKQLRKRPHSKLYALLGNLMSAENDLGKAMEYYTVAINLNPKNREAVAGLLAMGQPTAAATALSTSGSGNISKGSAALDAMSGHSTYAATGAGSQSSSDEESRNFDMSAAMAEPGSDNPAAIGSGGGAGAAIEVEETLWSDIDIDAMVTL